ncbi:pyroglutamyl-peptidase I [Carnobacteriaceae bacterium zg-84]|uniref:pyroglutamyl-peptidase I n=1 Tax=Granulicatella sp. zg-84 TaxID=2678503 RepID=UPI0013BF871D|nr:pyroglutamyl-peptidase I [Granulicatella sp. zg-84]NEW66775.1 pyroglutamyl-peptidase I [Granulicatella sp. zg-84]QMI85355.1 pyroglutamyl-peptidase I [Carnobacteriaceae bacterium zg-84]
MKILVTGFDPFGGETINPAWEAVKQLPETLNGATIKKIQIPTVFHDSADVVFKEIDTFSPDVVLCIGQAGGRVGVTPERVAINVDDARIPDNNGKQPIDVCIQPDGEPAYFSTLPIKAMVNNMKKEGVPSSVSNSAGTFVCNHIMYQVLYYLSKHYPESQGGFIHVPFIPTQVVDKPTEPSMSLDDIVKGLTSSLKTIVDYHGKNDDKLVGGQTH